MPIEKTQWNTGNRDKLMRLLRGKTDYIYVVTNFCCCWHTKWLSESIETRQLLGMRYRTSAFTSNVSHTDLLVAHRTIKKNIPYNLRDSSRAQLSKPSRSKYDINSISYKGSSLWNALPRDMKKCLDLNTFKNMLKSWNGPPCSCGFCVTCRF